MVRSKASGRAPKSIDEHVGQRLRSAREAISEKPEKIARIMGVSVESYERIERGEERPSGLALHSAAVFLNVGITYFFTDFSTQGATAPSVAAGVPPKPTKGQG
jgi:transcriptional regulator with XRE-family HTH domain